LREALPISRVLRDWREGRDTDGLDGTPLDADLTWQPELWRRLVAAVDAPPPDVRHEQTVARLRAGEGGDLPLPDRLSLFGHTRLGVTEVELLDALATSREVNLWLPQPSEALWQELQATQASEVVPRDRDDSSHLVRHPLLASLGRDSRQLVRVLGSFADPRRDPPADGPTPPTRNAGPKGAEAEPTTVLGWLQADIAANRDPSGEPQREVAAGDGSVQVHACHGPTRQVEVLREVLVGLLEDDPDLEPRDVLVMCPDVETYAPLIGAAFGLGEHGTDAEGVDTHPAHRLRVRLADRSLRSTNPLLDVAARLIGLAGGRLTASEVLDLAAAPPVRRRFGLGEDDLATITRWVTDAGIRWGLDAEHRAPFAMEREDQGTWRFGLDRLLLGVTMSEDGPLHVAAVMPVDDVGSGSVDLVGRLGELIDR